MNNSSVPISPSTVNSLKKHNFTFKLVKSKRIESNKNILTVSQKIIDASCVFEKERIECLKVIEKNKRNLEKELRINDELQNELDKLLRAGYVSPRSSVKIESDGSLVEYYKNKLDEIEKLVDSMRKEYNQMIKIQESENKMLKRNCDDDVES